MSRLRWVVGDSPEREYMASRGEGERRRGYGEGRGYQSREQGKGEEGSAPEGEYCLGDQKGHCATCEEASSLRERIEGTAAGACEVIEAVHGHSLLHR